MARQENVKKKSTPSSGSFHNWESETLRLLARHEHNSVDHPRGEVTSRVFDRLMRITVRDLAHLRKLIPRLVHQARMDIAREDSRHFERFVSSHELEIPAPVDGLCGVIADQKEFLLGNSSPLDGFEKDLIREALKDPAQFIRRRNGALAHRALARKFRVDPTTIRNRWLKIVQKVAALSQPNRQMDLSL